MTESGFWLWPTLDTVAKASASATAGKEKRMSSSDDI